MSSNLHQPDLRDMLLDAGIGQYNAIMSIPYMNFLPRTTDPYAQGVIQIVQGLQRMLNWRGSGLDVDGRMGDSTIAELLVYAGPRWYDKSWAQLYADVRLGYPWKNWPQSRQLESKTPAGPQQPMGDIADVLSSPLVWVAGFVAYLWYSGNKQNKEHRDRVKSEHYRKKYTGSY